MKSGFSTIDRMPQGDPMTVSRIPEGRGDMVVIFIANSSQLYQSRRWAPYHAGADLALVLRGGDVVHYGAGPAMLGR